jgi:membrane peptidoglycan carboxypeptidase
MGFSFMVCGLFGLWVIGEAQDFLSESFDLHLPIIERQNAVSFDSVDQFPKDLIDMLLVSEDEVFWQHPGFSIKAILRAFWSNIQGLFSDGSSSIQGGSTITQQLAKNLYLDPGRTLQRKQKELYLALQLERNYSKSMILELYLNTAYMGNGIWGMGQASRAYFGVDPIELSPWQSLMLVVTLRSPEHRNPMSGNFHIIFLCENMIDHMGMSPMEKGSIILAIKEFLECN